MATDSLHPSTMLLLIAGSLKWWNIFIICSAKKKNSKSLMWETRTKTRALT